MLVHWVSSIERRGLSEMNLDIEVEEVKEQQEGVISCGSCFLLSEFYLIPLIEVIKSYKIASSAIGKMGLNCSI